MSNDFLNRLDSMIKELDESLTKLEGMVGSIKVATKIEHDLIHDLVDHPSEENDDVK